MSDDFDFLKMLLGVEKKDVTYSKFVDFFPAIVYVYDVNSRKLLYSNSKLNDFLGYSFDEIKDSEYNSLVFPEDIDLVRKELQKFQILKDEDSYCYNCRLNHKKGHWRQFRTLGSVLRRSEEGQPSSILFIAQDITDQLKSENELKALNDLLVETEAMLHFGSWHWDAKADAFTFSSSLNKILDTDPKTPLTWNDYKQFIQPEDREMFNRQVQNALATQSGFECEYIISTAAGKHRIVSTQAKTVVNDKGEVVKIVGITIDITAKKNAERERERIIRELRRSNKELEEFAYVASHDLQEPLRKIITFGERLKTKFSTNLGDDGTAYLDRILVSTENMRNLIENLLEFSRTTRSTYAFQLTDMNEIMSSVMEELDLSTSETEADISIGSLPLIEAVPSEMKQLFTNLISNSLKFRKPGNAPMIEIKSEPVERDEKATLNLTADKPYVKITVLDHGIGFEEEYAYRIFQIFQRLHGKSEYPGSGIGLAICKKIVDNHNGLLFARGNPGSGAAFYIVLPIKQEI